MREKQDDLVYLQHMRDAADKILAYAASSALEKFSNNEWDQAAVIRYFEIIGEAATKLSTEFKLKHKEIEWRDVSDFRNFLIHDYMDIDIKIVWETMTLNLPSLKKQIDHLIEGK